MKGDKNPRGRKGTKGDEYSFKGESRVERATTKGYAIHLTQVGKDWWGWQIFKGRTAIGREDFHAPLDLALREANEFIRAHAGGEAI